MFVLISSLLITLSSSVNAAESGYLYMGKNHVLYKDGAQKEEMPKELRSPASFKVDNSPSQIIRYEVDTENGVVCYWRDGASLSTPLTCVKK